MDQNYDGIYTTKLDDTGKKNIGSDKTLAGITVTLVQTEPNTKDEKPVYIDGDNSYYAVTDTLGNEVQPVTTTSDGRYTFENLKQGNYRVLFKDSENGYMMEDDSKPVLPFGKLSVTKRDAMGDTSNKTAPQYGTEDANTLQAAMSGKITLGDAVLTGRDDKTNINAGFYYTELRLAKVWQNIPDAKKAAEAKVDFTLAATQGENELEEAVYTLTNKTVSDPAKAAQDASDLTLFGKFLWAQGWILPTIPTSAPCAGRLRRACPCRRKTPTAPSPTPSNRIPSEPMVTPGSAMSASCSSRLPKRSAAVPKAIIP